MIIVVIHSLSAMGMRHLLHYIGADTAGPAACILVTAYYRPARDIYKYFVICHAICVMLLNCHYFGGNEAQPVINWTPLRWGGSCLCMNADFTPQINQRQIKINYLLALSVCISFSGCNKKWRFQEAVCILSYYLLALDSLCFGPCARVQTWDIQQAMLW